MAQVPAAVSVRRYAQTARLRLRLRAGGFDAGRMTCEGCLPVLHTGGDCRFGLVRLRGVVAPVELGAVRGGELRMGDDVFVNQGASIVAAHSITIGDHVLIGDFAALYDSNLHAVEPSTPVREGPVEIGRNVWIGRGAIVLPGVTIGDHSVVGANSVVTDDVPARTLAVGNPARAVRTFEVADDWRRL
ncbi:MAG: hypothetical protein QOK25_2209 [Thermoleophilaceae bacterium]|nr:hypothetical protein [Thermoleophilaceae bacterium]